MPRLVSGNTNATAMMIAERAARIMTGKETHALFSELAERKRQIAGTMSGGQQQMLAIGHAMMSRPQYLVIDEMSLGLAPLIVKRLVAAIGKLVAAGTGVNLIEQFTEVALALADDAIVMRRGQILYAGAARTLKDDLKLLELSYF